MSSVAAFFVFLLIMLALATLAIILDWMGKPIRRTFRPRTGGTPAWLAVDGTVPPQVLAEGPSPDLAHQSAETPATPPALEAPPASDGRVAPNPAPIPDQPAAPQPAATSDQPAAPQPPGQPQAASAPRPWQAGDSIFQLTPRGTAPSITAIRRRYWKNLSEHRASAVFGAANRELMAIGQAPQRFNPRTGAIEELSLPEPMLRQCWATGRRPSPTWEDRGLDPFAQP